MPAAWLLKFCQTFKFYW